MPHQLLALAPILLMALLQTSCSVLQSGDVGGLTQALRKQASQAPLLNRLLEKPPAITTSIADAKTELPLLDRYAPERVGSLTALPRSSNGGFVLRPGAFEMVAQSYCLHAGTYGPTEGDGYLLAPLLGPAEQTIRHILQNSARAPEVPQSDVQQLIWAILAHAKVEDLDRRLQIAAARLLSPAEVATLNRNALDLVPASVKQEALSRMPPPAAAIFEAEATLREMLTRTNASYEEMERVAVRAGVAPPGPGSRDVSRGRWSYHPSGFFVRYFPEGYSTTHVQVVVPEPISVERDKLGRITVLSDGRGNRVETAYDDSQPALTFTGEPGLKGHAFRSVRVVRRHISPPEVVLKLEARWQRRGWVLTGVPSGSTPAPASQRFPDAGTRATWAAEQTALLKQLSEQVRHAPPAPEALAEAVALAEFTQALDRVPGGEAPADNGIGDPSYLAQQAWLHAVCRMLGGCGATLSLANEPPRGLLASASGLIPASAMALAPSAPSASPAKSGPTFDPSGDVAAPGNTSRQRLAQSERPKDQGRNQDCDRAQKDRDEAQKLRDAYGDAALKEKARKEKWPVPKFKEEAHKQVFGPGAKEGGSGKQGDYEAPMWTNSTTCKVNENWDRERYKQEGYGEVNYEADRVHEAVHEKHCRSYRNPLEYHAKMGDVDGLSQDEVNAYQAKIDFLDKWMATNCQ
jgi:hypothetical protein